jgi:lysine 6-dehydrogenase
MNVFVLGAGRVGSAIAVDLAVDQEFDVHVADRDSTRLNEIEERWGIRGERVDFSLPSTVARAVRDADLVISAVPGFLGHRTLQAVIEAGKNVVDIAFFAEDPFSLDDPARANGVAAIVDCGVAPGLSNLLVGHATRAFDSTESVAIYVGGLPADPQPPYEYRAVFSPIDVIEEYVRPARLVVDGRIETRPALSEVEPIDFDGIGRLEAFNTDGLRTVMKTIACPNMIEKTLRYPGHADKVRLLRDTGFFSDEPLEIDGHEIRPIDVTSALLFPLWQMREGEEDVTVLRVIVNGSKDGESMRRAFDLVDRFDKRTKTTSMARTTGYTATMAARMLDAGMLDETGVIAPESLASDPARVAFILDGLRQRGIDVRETVSAGR